ncbi:MULTISPECIES: ArsR/SmtB family transcription factor [Chryseobacterium]|uniref:ArsR/SmtB family transcription factor n=1 Tax=Chryseobacterium sp. R2A-55 TaxID=2744445 RepID=UPI001F341D38|nr:metalloregulator ArsR/SmtB family transcription factor [Chryseobacterium sp. R2A-55]
MGVTKTENFTQEQNEIATFLKALAHPARIAIIEYLLSVDSCICNDIVDEVKLAQPTVSQHLKELKNAGIIQGEIDGKSICYCINPENLRKLEHFVNGLFQKIHQQNGGLCC